jgi:hypothetical protein
VGHRPAEDVFDQDLNDREGAARVQDAGPGDDGLAAQRAGSQVMHGHRGRNHLVPGRGDRLHRAQGRHLDGDPEVDRSVTKLKPGAERLAHDPRARSHLGEPQADEMADGRWRYQKPLEGAQLIDPRQGVERWVWHPAPHRLVEHPRSLRGKGA